MIFISVFIILVAWIQPVRFDGGRGRFGGSELGQKLLFDADRYLKPEIRVSLRDEDLWCFLVPLIFTPSVGPKEQLFHQIGFLEATSFQFLKRQVPFLFQEA